MVIVTKKQNNIYIHKLIGHATCNMIRQDMYACKVSKYAYGKYENKHVMNLKI